jgi:hypothetical protein
MIFTRYMIGDTQVYPDHEWKCDTCGEPAIIVSIDKARENPDDPPPQIVERWCWQHYPGNKSKILVGDDVIYRIDIP